MITQRPRRATVQGGSLLLDRRPISEETAEELIARWSKLAADYQVSASVTQLRQARVIATDVVELEQALNQWRRVRPVRGFVPARSYQP